MAASQSSYKKALKLNQKTHRERHQPAERAHLGNLEKHQDYKRRAEHGRLNRDALKILHQKAIDKNPDEYPFSAKYTRPDRNDPKVKIDADKEQRLMLKGSYLNYIKFMRTKEMRKVQKLQGQLSMISLYNLRGGKGYKVPKIVNAKGLTIEDVYSSTWECRKNYQELSYRIRREQELRIIEQKHEARQNKSKNCLIQPHCVQKESRRKPAVYKWTYERKR